MCSDASAKLLSLRNTCWPWRDAWGKASLNMDSINLAAQSKTVASELPWCHEKQILQDAAKDRTRQRLPRQDLRQGMPWQSE